MKRHTRAAAAVPLLLTAFLWAVRAEAQDVSAGGSGHFMLPFPVDWAGRTLAPGRYTLTLMPRRTSAIFIKVTGQGASFLLMPSEFSSRDSGENRLALVSSHGRRTVRALGMAGLTATFRTPRRDAPAERGPEWAASDIGSPEFVPVAATN